jgi:ABC-type multidrug transport system ATPase subunit
VERGQKIGLVGINGAGKSTLLKLLAGEEDVTSGEVRIGSSVNRSYYAQHQLEILDPNETVFDTICKVGTGWSETKIRTYLGSFLFSGDEIEKYIKVLSGGEKARLALAHMLVDPSHLLLLDEPTNHLDMVSRNVVEKALGQYVGSIVCISHDRHFLNHITTQTCEVGKGRIRMYEGNYEYYEWKKKKSIPKDGSISKERIKQKVKSDYKERKKLRNRLAWIRKRNKSIETELENQRIIVQDPDNGGNYDVLQKAMELMNRLEKEYLELMEEEDVLNNNK